jgi:hypothetical protein
MKIIRKPRLLLPAINVTLSVILFGIGYTRPKIAWAPVPWEIALADSINAPANMMRYLVEKAFDKHVYLHCSDASVKTCLWIGWAVEDLVFLLGILFVWYFVGLEIEAGRQRSRATARFGTLTRVLADAGLLLLGPFFAFLTVAYLRFDGTLYALFYLAWALAIIVTYGRDIVLCIFRSREAQHHVS